MLRSFTVSNWKSYYEPAEFSMVATRERRHGERLTRVRRSRILPVSAIYGANAAGKSTLIEALVALRTLIIDARRVGSLLPVMPHLPEGKHEPSKFYVEFLTELEGDGLSTKEAILTYELAADRRRIYYEALLIRRGDREDFLFEREGSNVQLDEPLLGDKRTELHSELISDNETLLGALGPDPEVANPHVKAAYNWFARQLNVIYPDSRAIYLPAQFATDDLFADAVNTGLTRADTGISGLQLQDMRVESLPLEPDEIDFLLNELSSRGGIFVIGGGVGDYALLDLHKEELRARRLVATHSTVAGPGEVSEEFLLPLREESEGTQRFMNLLPALFQLRKADSRAVFLIDELEHSMHPKLTEEFIRTFLDDLDGSNRRQLIFTTHEIQLMRSDLLRRDEIWLVDKVDGQSELTRVSDFSDIGVRKDADLMSFYMSGRLGGVPRI
ncbi:MAG: ATP-binding protein [Actinomycetaceae bacterium]|nr:ATP-binding protein [Actinomycetaceae bacterium]